MDWVRHIMQSNVTKGIACYNYCDYSTVIFMCNVYRQEREDRCPTNSMTGDSGYSLNTVHK